MYVSRYVSRLLVPSSVINSAKREVFINRQKQVGEKTSGNQDSNSTGNQDSNHGNSISGRPKGNKTGEKTPTSKTPVRGKQLNKSKGVNRLYNKWKYN